jgi:hypothetical protein
MLEHWLIQKETGMVPDAIIDTDASTDRITKTDLKKAVNHTIG